MMFTPKSWIAGATAAVTVSFASAMAYAEDLPKTFAWTAYGTKSSGYAASVAIANALAEEGYKLRVLPAKNDVSRMTPLRTGKALASAMGVGSFQAQEGVLDFGKKPWGPQKVQMIMMGWGDQNTALPATAADANIKSAADLKGKRIAWVHGAPALNQNMEAWLAYGNLTWDDVTKVEVPGWGASVQGIIDGQIDAAIGSTNSSMFHQLASSPRGLHFFPAPKEETENWARLNKVAPWFTPHVATAGVGLSADAPHIGATFGYPIVIANQSTSDDAIYQLTKLMHTKYPNYKDGHSAAAGFDMDRQVFQWIIPYHAGAVRYFKEIGVWSDEDEAHNQRLLKRQEILAATWDSVGGMDSDYDEWMAARAAALTAEGFEPVWEK